MDSSVTKLVSHELPQPLRLHFALRKIQQIIETHISTSSIYLAHAAHCSTCNLSIHRCLTFLSKTCIMVFRNVCVPPLSPSSVVAQTTCVKSWHAGKVPYVVHVCLRSVLIHEENWKAQSRVEDGAKGRHLSLLQTVDHFSSNFGVTDNDHGLGIAFTHERVC